MLVPQCVLLVAFHFPFFGLSDGKIPINPTPRPHHKRPPELFKKLIYKHPKLAPHMKDLSEILTEGFLKVAKKSQDFETPPKVDLTFAVAASDHVGPFNFRRQLWFVKKMIREFSVSPSGTRVAMVSYGTTPKAIFGLLDNVNRECTAEAVGKAKFNGGQSAPGKALMYIRDRILTVHNGSRIDARRVLFLFLNKEPGVGIDVSLEAEALRGDGVEVFVLFVDPSGASDESIRTIASTPARTHFISVRSFEDIGSIAYLSYGKGFSRECEGDGIVFDECNRRCTCQNGKRVNCFRVRKEFLSMSARERALYLAVLLEASTDPEFKADYSRVLDTHRKFYRRIIARQYFFPWIRWYILTFENALRKVDCRVTVPYWDWSESKSNGTFYSEEHARDLWSPYESGLGGDGVPPRNCVEVGPFRSDVWAMSPTYSCLKRNFRPENLKRVPSTEQVHELLKTPMDKFEMFESTVRIKWHKTVREAIGGTMAGKESSSAPEFWFHHAFLDKLWSDWQKRGAEFKFHYFRGVHSTMPGTGGRYGRDYMDLDNQPMCVRAVYDDAE